MRSGDKILIFLCSSLLQQIFYQWPVARSHCRPGNIPWSILLLVAEEEKRGRSKYCVWCPRSPEKAIWQDHLSEKGSCSDKLDVTSVLASASLMAFCSSSAWLRGPGAAYWIQPGINHYQRMEWGKSAKQGVQKWHLHGKELLVTSQSDLKGQRLRVKFKGRLRVKLKGD